MKKDVEFKAQDGVTLRSLALFARPALRESPDHCDGTWLFSREEMYLDKFAEVFAAAGLGALVFDNRNFGASGGEPRHEIDPWEQVRDYRDAITFAETLPETDADRIGIWGSSYSGGHVLVVGAIDRRVKCVAGQVPLISGHNNARRLIRADFWPACTACSTTIGATAMRGNHRHDPRRCRGSLAPSALPTPDSWSWFTETGRTRAPSWRNEVTLAQSRCSPNMSRVPTSALSARRRFSWSWH